MANANIAELERIIGYHFHDDRNVSIAISHPGVKKNKRLTAKAFERLEFLGDRVLGLSLASFLYDNFKKDSEGELAIRMATLAGTEFLIQLAKQTKMMDCFDIPKDFFVSLHKTSSSIADMVEAVLGAIYLDSDFKTVESIVRKLWANDINKIVYKEKDAKTHLQEIVQEKSHSLPVYRLIKMSGEAHDPVFEVEVVVSDQTAIGYGTSKKNAEHDAADKMIKQLQVETN